MQHRKRGATIDLKNHEVEFRAVLTPIQRRGVVRKIKKQGGVLQSRCELTDVYYCPASVNNFRQIEMNQVGSFSLRLRNRRDGGVTPRADLNMKVITHHGDHNAWDEYEVSVDSLETTEKILRAIGYKPFCELKKKRSSFRLRHCTILVDDIVRFGPIIEIEIVTTRQQRDKAKAEAYSLLKKLGIHTSQIVRKSVTNLFMKRYSSFQERRIPSRWRAR